MGRRRRRSKSRKVNLPFTCVCVCIRATEGWKKNRQSYNDSKKRWKLEEEIRRKRRTKWRHRGKRKKIYILKRRYRKWWKEREREREGNREIARATEKGKLPSRKEYKCEDVLGSGKNPNGIGSGNRSGRTTWWRIGVRLPERGAWRDMWDDAWTHGQK